MERGSTNAETKTSKARKSTEKDETTDTQQEDNSKAKAFLLLRKTCFTKGKIKLMKSKKAISWGKTVLSRSKTKLRKGETAFVVGTTTITHGETTSSLSKATLSQGEKSVTVVKTSLKRGKETQWNLYWDFHLWLKDTNVTANSICTVYVCVSTKINFVVERLSRLDVL